MTLTARGWTALAVLLLWLLSATGCASPSPITPTAAEPPRVPPRPVTSEPAPSGSFWTMHCELLLRSQKALNVPLPMPEFCSTAGRSTQ